MPKVKPKKPKVKKKKEERTYLRGGVKFGMGQRITHSELMKKLQEIKNKKNN